MYYKYRQSYFFIERHKGYPPKGITCIIDNKVSKGTTYIYFYFKIFKLIYCIILTGEK